MTKQRIKTLTAGAVVILAVAGMVLFTRVRSQFAIKGHLRNEDPPLIQQAVSRYRWRTARETLANHDIKFLFSSCFRLVETGCVCEIGSMPDRPLNGWGLSVTNPSSRAYALATESYSHKSIQYLLTLTTNGWEVDEGIYRR